MWGSEALHCLWVRLQRGSAFTHEIKISDNHIAKQSWRETVPFMEGGEMGPIFIQHLQTESYGKLMCLHISLAKQDKSVWVFFYKESIRLIIMWLRWFLDFAPVEQMLVFSSMSELYRTNAQNSSHEQTVVPRGSHICCALRCNFTPLKRFSMPFQRSQTMALLILSPSHAPLPKHKLSGGCL